MASSTSARLLGKRALVTGAASGIGLATARRFAQEGAHVALLDREADRAARLAAELAGGVVGDVAAVGADVAAEEEVEQAVAFAARRFGGLDVVVVNAAVQVFGRDAEVHELDADVWDTTHAVNLRGAFLTAKHGVRALLVSGGGSLIFTASPTGLVGSAPGFTAYSSSKAGVVGLMRTVAAGYATRGIRSNAVVPGFTDTPLVASIDERERDDLLDTIPMRRQGTAEEVAGLMAYLASDEAAYATGALFTIDGGITAV